MVPGCQKGLEKRYLVYDEKYEFQNTFLLPSNLNLLPGVNAQYIVNIGPHSRNEKPIAREISLHS